MRYEIFHFIFLAIVVSSIDFLVNGETGVRNRDEFINFFGIYIQITSYFIDIFLA